MVQANSRSAVRDLSKEALRSLTELDARLSPAEAAVQPAFNLQFETTCRLDPDVTAFGGLVAGRDGHDRPHYCGHRKRLRDRLLKGGHNLMPDDEVMKLLLFNPAPPINTKLLEKRLLTDFGDLNGVVAASADRVTMSRALMTRSTCSCGLSTPSPIA